MLNAGVAERIITPNFPTLLAGYPEPKDRYATDVHDDLRVHAFYLSDGLGEYVIATLDLVNYSKKRVGIVRKKIEAATGIPCGNICISCTHTHSGPVTQTVPFWIRDDRKEMYPFYLDFVDSKIVEAVSAAKQYSFPAQIGFAKGYCGKEQGVGGNRRQKEGTCDPEVGVIALREAATGVVKGILVNYALHPTFLHAESTSITADYPAYIYEYFKTDNSGLVVGFSIGAAGNQSSRHYRSGQTFEEAKRVGHAIGKAAEDAILQMHWTEQIELSAASSFVTPPLREIPPLEQAIANQQKAEQDLADAKASGKPYAFCRTLECTLIGANSMLRTARQRETAIDSYSQNAPFEIFLLKLGNACYVSVPGEFFVEFGLYVKKNSPSSMTFFSTCSNGGAAGYLCTAEAHKEGGYEALISMYLPDAGQLIAESAVALLKSEMK